MAGKVTVVGIDWDSKPQRKVRNAVMDSNLVTEISDLQNHKITTIFRATIDDKEWKPEEKIFYN